LIPHMREVRWFYEINDNIDHIMQPWLVEMLELLNAPKYNRNVERQYQRLAKRFFKYIKDYKVMMVNSVNNDCSIKW
jgi:hypothetical protein